LARGLLIRLQPRHLIGRAAGGQDRNGAQRAQEQIGRAQV
jgi:hypothetical protein